MNYKLIFNKIKQGKFKYLRKILETKDDFDVNVKDEHNHYILNYAILFNKIDIIKLLIEHDCVLTYIDDNGRTILHYVVDHNYINALELLLNYNTYSIGESIVNIRDNNGNIPIYYAIKYKNEKIISLLLKFESNVNLLNNTNKNGLHFAINTKSIEICKMIINNITDKKSYYETYDPPLFTAIKLKHYDIVKLLLDNEFNPNVVNVNTTLSALHMAAVINDISIFKLLLSYGANINNQNNDGESPFFWLLEDNKALILSNDLYENVQFNLVDKYGNTVLHHLFSNYTDDIDLEKIILKTNLVNQNVDGINCTYYIIKYSLWEKYDLTNKKLDLFTNNVYGQEVCDIILSYNNQKYNKFLDILTLSYVNNLKEITYCNKLDNDCGNKKKSFDECYKNIRIILDNKIKSCKTHNQECENNCISSTYPIPYYKNYIKFTDDKKIDVCYFMGDTLDITTSILFLMKKHKNVRGLILFNNKQENIDHCRLNDLIIEIEWNDFKLVISNEYINELKKLSLDKKYQFIVIPLGITLSRKMADDINKYDKHANYILYDVSKNTVERFEPYGSASPYDFYYDPELLDNKLTNVFRLINESIIYIRPYNYLPRIGFQYIESMETQNRKHSDPGFCAVWSIWYVDMRIKYATIPPSKLVKTLLEIVRRNNMSLKNIIRNYSNNVFIMKKKLLSQANIDVNDWENMQYSCKQYNLLISMILNMYNKL